jgi:hypothetical protein
MSNQQTGIKLRNYEIRNKRNPLAIYATMTQIDFLSALRASLCFSV